VLDIVNKIKTNMTEREAKLIHYEDVNQLVKETKTAKMEKDRAVADLIAQTDPLRVGSISFTYDAILIIILLFRILWII